ncbi:MAG: recombinase family protein [Planctomycetota bacterium]|jgi:hypothetical protein
MGISSSTTEFRGERRPSHKPTGLVDLLRAWIWSFAPKPPPCLRVAVEILRDEGLSGKSLDRPGIQQLLASCRAGDVSEVIVVKLDRVTDT